MTLLDEITAKLQALPKDDLERVAKEAVAATSHMIFLPNEGPQTDAYNCQADVLLYGGQAGGGKSMLEIGWGVNESESGIIFRRQRTQTDGLEKEGKKLLGDKARFNGQDLEWTWPSGKTLKLAGMNLADDWMAHAGRERDYMGFDEAGEFLEMQVAQIIAWLRAPPGKRCRVILGSNPPRAMDGRWLLKWFAPWLDKTFPNPAHPGELRWACGVTKDDQYSIHWVDGPGEYEIDGEMYRAKSYTFIPASLQDNPFRNTPEYRAQLQSLPEPLRSQLLYGDFTAGTKDQDYQVIPTAWVRAAMDRWKADGYKDHFMTAMGFDPAGGGSDPAALAWRHGGWYAEVDTFKGEETADGSSMAAGIIKRRRNNAPVVVDMGGGYGGAVTTRLSDNDIPHSPFKGSAGSTAKTRDGQLGFFNKRAEAWWKFREELDPDQEGGSVIALPDDPELLGDLTAPTYDVRKTGIIIQEKAVIRKLLGRSTNKGDAVVMCLSEGNAAVKRSLSQSQPIKVVMGHPNKRRTRR